MKLHLQAVFSKMACTGMSYAIVHCTRAYIHALLCKNVHSVPVHFRYFAISLTWQASMLECCIMVLPVPNCLDEHLSCNWWMKFVLTMKVLQLQLLLLRNSVIKKAASNVKSCCAKGTRLLKYVVFVKSVHVDHVVKPYLLLVKNAFDA